MMESNRSRSMWKYKIYYDSDVVRWAENYIFNSDGSNIVLNDFQRKILSDGNRKIVLGARQSGVSTVIMINILYDIVHSDYREVIIFTDTVDSTCRLLHNLTTRCMMPNAHEYTINWSNHNRYIDIDHDPYGSPDHNGYRSHITIERPSDINESLMGKDHPDVYFDVVSIASFPCLYEYIPGIMVKQSDNRLWICNTMSRAAPDLNHDILNDLVQKRYEYEGFNIIWGDI